jgi:hypothetical protein
VDGGRPPWRVNITPHVKVDRKSALRLESEFGGTGLLTSRPFIQRDRSYGGEEDSTAAGRRLYEAGVERKDRLDAVRAEQEREKARHEEVAQTQFRAKPAPGVAEWPGASSGLSVAERTRSWMVQREEVIQAKKALLEAVRRTTRRLRPSNPRASTRPVWGLYGVVCAVQEAEKALTFKPKLSKRSQAQSAGEAGLHERVSAWEEVCWPILSPPALRPPSH